jgi:hypothetical protein
MTKGSNSVKISAQRGLTPFKPGETGNPNGRPKTNPEIKEMFRAATPMAAAFLIKLANNQKAKIPERIKAAEIIIDHGIGKAVQEVNLNGEVKTVISFDPILREELG